MASTPLVSQGVLGRTWKFGCLGTPCWGVVGPGARRAACGTSSPFPGENQASRLYVPGRGTEPTGTYDPKPELAKRNGQLPPPELLQGYRAAFINPNSALLGGKFGFAPHGNCGMELSEVLPQIAGIADQMVLIRSMQTDAVNHAPAQIMMNSGSQQFGRPSLGSWTLYGLGSESKDLPGFVVLTSAKGTSGGASTYGSGFLPLLLTHQYT